MINLDFAITIGIMCTFYAVAIIAITRYMKSRDKRIDTLERYKIKRGIMSERDKREILKELEKELPSMIRDELTKLIK